MQSTRRLSATLAIAAAMASVSSLSALGAQTQMRPQVAMPGERLRPPKPKAVRAHDPERLAACHAKRARRSAIWSRRVANGHQKQLATPRSAA